VWQRESKIWLIACWTWPNKGIRKKISENFWERANQDKKAGSPLYHKRIEVLPNLSDLKFSKK